MNQARQRVKILRAVFLALFAVIAAFAVTKAAIATSPDEEQYTANPEPTVVCPETEESCEPTEETTIASPPPEETTVIPPEETTMPTTPEPTASVPPETTMLPPETTGPTNPNPPNNPGPGNPNTPDRPGDEIAVVNTPDGPAPITVTITETTLVCETPERVFEVARTDLDEDGAISNVEDRAMVVAAETGSTDAVTQNTAASEIQAERAVAAVRLPDTGGVGAEILLPLAALLVGAAILAFAARLGR